MSKFSNTAYTGAENPTTPGDSGPSPEADGWLQRFRSSAGVSRAAAGSGVPGKACNASGRRKAIIYAKSSATGASSASVERQVATCTRYANDTGMDVDDVYAEELRQGRDTVGPRTLMDLMIRVRGGGVDAVVIDHPSRLARDVEEMALFRHWLSAWGVELHSATVGWFEGAASPASIDWERAFTEARVRRTSFCHGMMVKDGRVPWGGGRLFGYERDGHVGGRIKVREDEREIVLDVFRMARGGVSHAGIARILNSEGRLGRRSKPWAADAICRMLANPLYRGVIVYGRDRRREDSNSLKVRVTNAVEVDRETGFAAHLVIVEDGLWNDVQSRRRPGHVDRRRQRGPHLLSGLVRCPVCDAAMASTGRSGGYGCRLACPARARGKCCDNRRGWDMAWVEAATLGLLAGVLDEASTDESYLKGLTEVAEAEERRGQLESRLAALEADLAETSEASGTTAFHPSIIDRIRAAKRAEHDGVAAMLRTFAPRRGPIDVTPRRAELAQLAVAVRSLAAGGRVDGKTLQGAMLTAAIRGLIRCVVPTPIPGSRGVAVEVTLAETGFHDPCADVDEGPTRIVRGTYVPSSDRARKSRRSDQIGADRRGRGAAGPRSRTPSALLARLLGRPDGATLEELRIETGRSPAAIRRSIARLQRAGLRVTKAERPDGRSVWHAVSGAA